MSKDTKTKEETLKIYWEENFTTPYETSLVKDYEDVVVPAMNEYAKIKSREKAIAFVKFIREMGVDQIREHPEYDPLEHAYNIFLQQTEVK
jgi:hypothetical protein